MMSFRSLPGRSPLRLETRLCKKTVSIVYAAAAHGLGMVSISHACLAFQPAVGPRPGTDAMLDLIGPVAGQRALVVGPGALEVMCALGRRGAVVLTSLPAMGRGRAEAVDFVVAPNVVCVDTAEVAVLRARSSRRQRLVLGFEPGDGLGLVRRTRLCLLHHGFSAGRAYWLEQRVVVISDALPRAGGRGCARVDGGSPTDPAVASRRWQTASSCSTDPIGPTERASGWCTT